MNGEYNVREIKQEDFYQLINESIKKDFDIETIYIDTRKSYNYNGWKKNF